MKIILKPGFLVLVVDGTAHYLAHTPTLAVVEVLEDVLGWTTRHDAHSMTITLTSPECGCASVAVQP